MKAFMIICIALGSLNVFASDELRCRAEYRALNAEYRKHVQATDAVFTDSIDTANYVVSEGHNLIAQPNARVGGYGYNVRDNGLKAVKIANSLNSKAKAQEEVVLNAMIALEDCLYQ